MGQHNYLQLKTHITISVPLIAWSYINVSWFNTFFSNMHGNCFLCIWNVSLTVRWFLNLSRFFFSSSSPFPSSSSNCSFFFEGRFPLSCTERRAEAELQFIYSILKLTMLEWFCFAIVKIASIEPQHLQLENDSNFPPGGLYASLFREYLTWHLDQHEEQSRVSQESL